MSTRHTDALRERASLEARMVAARLDGEATARAGEPRANPWRGDAPDAVSRVLARMWAAGFSAGNPLPTRL